MCTALVVPVEARMIFWAVPQPSCRSFQRAVHSLMGGSDGIGCGHESLDGARVVIDDHGQRDQALGGAGALADNLEGVILLLMVLH